MAVETLASQHSTRRYPDSLDCDDSGRGSLQTAFNKLSQMAPVLYYCEASCPSRATLMVVRAVGADVTQKSVDLLAKEHLKPDFLKINPQHTVPALTDGDLILTDSHVIATYLVNKYASSDTLYPKNPKERALVDQRLYFDAGTLFPKIKGICYPVLFLGKTTVDEDLKKGVHEAFGFLEVFLEGRPWVAGNKLTIADIACVASVSSLVEIGFDLSGYPNMKSWLALCQNHISGYEELNDPGAKQLGALIRSRSQPGQI